VGCLNFESEIIMRALALLGLFVGMGILVAQEPAPQKQDVPAKGDRPMGKGRSPGSKDGEKRGPLSWKKLLETNDKDKDGLLSKEELSGGRNMWDRWNKADANKDDKLSEKEFDDYQKQLMERFKGGRKREENKKD